MRYRVPVCAYCRRHLKLPGSNICQLCDRAAGRLAEIAVISKDDALNVIGASLPHVRKSDIGTAERVTLERNGLAKILIPAEQQRYLTEDEFPYAYAALDLEGGETVLVYGCGSGGFVDYLLTKDVDAWGIENSSFMAVHHKHERILDIDPFLGSLSKRKLEHFTGRTEADVLVTEFVMDSYPFDGLNAFHWLLTTFASKTHHIVQEKQDDPDLFTNQDIEWWARMYPDSGWLAL